MDTDADADADAAVDVETPRESFLVADDKLSVFQAANKVTVEDLQLALNTVFKQLSNAEEESTSQDVEDEDRGMILTDSTTPHWIKSFARRKSSMSENEIDKRSPPVNLYEVFPGRVKHITDYPEYWRRKSPDASPGPGPGPSVTSVSETILRAKSYTPEELFRFQDNGRSVPTAPAPTAHSGEYLPAGEYVVPMRDDAKRFSPAGSVWSFDAPSSARLEDEMNLSLMSDVDSNIMLDDDIGGLPN